MGTATVPLLDAIGIEHYCPIPEEGEREVAKAAMKAFTKRRPVAVLLNLDYWRA
jgi:sulfopyruvate decarboxylase TPP-binding subunit